VIIDTRSVPSGTELETDVCIIGAGAAGITLARELSDRSFSVAVLESGGFDHEPATQKLYAGENTGQKYFKLDGCRTRRFGGSTNCWAGLNVPLDVIDFEEREWVPHSGWPISRGELDPFYRRAQRLLGLGPFEYDGAAWADKAHPLLEIGRLRSQVFQLRARRFAKDFRRGLEKASNVRVYLHANVTDIETTKDGARVARVHLANLEGNKSTLKARVFVLATGGIENARILLASNKQKNAGLGNEHDLVGRYFMEHPHVDHEGVLVITRPEVNMGFFRSRKVRGTSIWGHLVLSPEALREEKLLNFGSVLFAEKNTDKTFEADVGRAAGNLDDWLAKTKLPRTDKKQPRVFELGNPCEQAPNPDSRVTLDDKRDALGMPRAKLDWQLSEIDKRSLRRVHEVMGLEFARAGFGRLKVTLNKDDKDWPDHTKGGNHHMGATRMHADPRQGVVDANCRVHSLENLYVGGSSVFTTSGAANPTLTVVALATRLADHLRKEVLT
jgi:choline dehydrogenase-like flavoprotein